MFFRFFNPKRNKYKKGKVIHIAFDHGMVKVVHSVRIEKVKGDRVYISFHETTLGELILKIQEMIREGKELNTEIERQKQKRADF